MTRDQKYDKMERDGFRPAIVMGTGEWVTRRSFGRNYKANSISGLFRQIYGY